MDLKLENLLLKKQILELQSQLLQQKYEQIKAEITEMEEKEKPSEE